MNQKPLKDRLTKTILERLRTRKMSNAEAADLMGVSVSYLSRTVAAMQVKEPGKTMLARKQSANMAATRRQHRERLAKMVKDGQLGIATAAKRANCSERTMARYIAKYIPPRRKRKA